MKTILYTSKDIIREVNLVLTRCEHSRIEAHHWNIRVVKASNDCLKCLYPNEDRSHLFHFPGEAYYECLFLSRIHVPSLEEIITDAVLTSSNFVSPITYDTWARNYGYMADSPKAQKIFREGARCAGMLKRLIGEENFKRMVPQFQEV